MCVLACVALGVAPLVCALSHSEGHVHHFARVGGRGGHHTLLCLYTRVHGEKAHTHVLAVIYYGSWLEYIFGYEEDERKKVWRWWAGWEEVLERTAGPGTLDDTFSSSLFYKMFFRGAYIMSLFTSIINLEFFIDARSAVGRG